MSALQNSTSDLLLASSGFVTDQSSWFAIQTRPRYEKKVAVELREKDINTFLPLSSATHQWSDRRRLVQVPLFAGYAFVRISPTLAGRISVLQTNGVIGFVGVRNIGIPIPDCEIEAVQAVIEAGVVFEPHRHLSVGQRVRICSGCFDGVSGILMGVNGDQSLIISINLIQRSIAMRVQGYKLEAI
jgi:transcription antitermination factor NusG